MKKILFIILLLAAAVRAWPAYTEIKWLPGNIQQGYYGDESVVEDKFPDGVLMRAGYRQYYFRGKGFMTNGPAIQYTELKINVRSGWTEKEYNWIVPYYCLEGFGHEEMPKAAVFYKNRIFIESWKTPCGNTDIHMWERTVFKGNPRTIAGYFTYGREKSTWGRKDLPFYYHWGNVYEWDPVTAAEYEEAVKNGDLLILQGAQYVKSKDDYLAQFRAHVKDESPQALFWDAIKKNDAAVVKAMLEKDPLLARITDEAYNTPLHADLEYNFRGAIYSELMKYGPDINAVNLKGETPLQRAVDNHNDKAVIDLAAAGAKIRYPSDDFLEHNTRLPVWQLVPKSAVTVYKNALDDGWLGDDAVQMWGYDPDAVFRPRYAAPAPYAAMDDAREKLASAFGLPLPGPGGSAAEKAGALTGGKKEFYLALFSGQAVKKQNQRYSSNVKNPGGKSVGMYVLYRVHRPGLKLLAKKAGVTFKNPESKTKPEVRKPAASPKKFPE